MNFLNTFHLLCTIESLSENKLKFFSREVCVLDTPSVCGIKVRINLETLRFRRSSFGKYGRKSKDDVGRLTSLRYVFLVFGSWLATFMTRGGNLPMLYDFELLYSNFQATGPLWHTTETLVLPQQGIRLVERTRSCDRETFVSPRTVSLAVDGAQWNLSWNRV
jgi:hypothetical protein